MRDLDNRSNVLDRRGAMKVAGAAITATTIPTTGVALAQGGAATSPSQERRDAPGPESPIGLTHKRATTNGITIHYVTVGRGPVVLCMHGWPQNHREFVPVMKRHADRYTFIAP